MSGHMIWDVWVFMEEDNPDWVAKPGTKYHQLLGERSRGKMLPIALGKKDAEKWIAASKLIPGLYKDFTETAPTAPQISET